MSLNLMHSLSLRDPQQHDSEINVKTAAHMQTMKLYGGLEE